MVTITRGEKTTDETAEIVLRHVQGSVREGYPTGLVLLHVQARTRGHTPLLAYTGARYCTWRTRGHTPLLAYIGGRYCTDG
jgi:hypothetical protein